MKKYIGAILSATLLVSLISFSQVQASALTQAQINAIVSLLQSFGADASVVANVQVALSGQTTASSTTSTSTTNICNNYWYFNDYYDANPTCQLKQFCDSYMYQGLKTFSTQASCQVALNAIPKPYITSGSPPSGPASTTVTLHGSNFFGCDSKCASTGNKAQTINVNLFSSNNTNYGIYARNITLIDSADLSFVTDKLLPIGTYKVSISGTWGQSNTINYTVTAPAAITCTDSDGGKNYMTSGSVVVSNLPNSPYADYCSINGTTSTTTLYEMYCENSQKKTTSYPCSNGCNNGACLPAITQPSITILSPNGGENISLSANDFKTTWSSSHTGNVAVYLQFSDGASCYIKTVPVSQGYSTINLGATYQCSDISKSITNILKSIIAGQYKVLLIANNGSFASENAIVSRDESDNYFTISAPAPAPSIVITNVQYSPSSPKVNDLITATVTVRNNGSGNQTTPFKVNVQSKTVTVPSLVTGAQTTVTVPNAFSFSSSGTKTLNTVIIDSAGNNGNIFTNTITIATATSVTCTDSDGGKNYMTSGSVVVSNFPNMKYADSCITNGSTGVGTLYETYCENNQKKTTAYVCPHGCARGACLPVTNPYTSSGSQTPRNSNIATVLGSFFTNAFVNFIKIITRQK